MADWIVSNPSSDTPASQSPAARPIITLLGVALITIAALLTGCEPENRQSDTVDITIAGREYTLELALDPAARHRGLSDRKQVPPTGGMLFAFTDADYRGFVMRKCLVPIDIIYLDPGGRIVSMHRMKVEPYDTPENDLVRYRSGWKSQFVIELAGGSLDALRLREGDKVDLPLADLKRRAR